MDDAMTTQTIPFAVTPTRGAKIAVMGDSGTLIAEQPGPNPMENGVVVAFGAIQIEALVEHVLVVGQPVERGPDEMLAAAAASSFCSGIFGEGFEKPGAGGGVCACAAGTMRKGAAAKAAPRICRFIDDSIRV